MKRLQALYDSEINWRIDTFWHSGFRWHLGLGDNVGAAWDAQGEADTLAEAIEQLVEAALLHHPKSAFASSELCGHYHSSSHGFPGHLCCDHAKQTT